MSYCPERMKFGVFMAPLHHRVGENPTLSFQEDLESGSFSHGQGHLTSFAQVVADVFKVIPTQVKIIQGDSRRVPPGVGTIGSRSMTHGGGAAKIAAGKVLDKMIDISAHMLEVEAADVVWDASPFQPTGVPARGVSWRDVVAVDDAGVIVNPLLAEAQIVRGIAQGFGQALYEEMAYDTDGTLLSGALGDYAMPRASDLPRFVIGQTCSPAPGNTLGTKGLGESGTVGAPPAIANIGARCPQRRGARGGPGGFPDHE
jgi:aerobic carbon-monoxide dehydrogenase large subunit